MSPFLKTTILTFALIGLTNCSGGSVGNSTSVAAGTNNGQSTGGDGSTGVVTPNPLDAVDLKGNVDSNDSNKGVLSFDFDKVRGEFIVMIPMPSGFLFSPSGSFAKYPDITFGTMLDAVTMKSKFGVRIPVKYIIKGSSFGAPSSLPNGNALPSMPAGYGELPSLALNFPQQGNTQITLYIGVNAIGLFMTLPENIAFPIGFTLPIKNKDKTKTFGYLTYVPKKGTYAPGLFVSSIIPATVARVLEDYFHL